MLPILLGLLGLGAAGAAAGGGGGPSKSAGKAPHVIDVPVVDADETPEPVHDVDDHAGDDSGHDDHGAGDDTLDGGTGHGDDIDDHDGDGGDTPDDDMGDSGDDTLHGGGEDHAGDGDDTVHGGGGDHMDHGGHGSDFVAVTAPETEAEIDDFVEAVMAASEMHTHDAASSKAGEHMAAMGLVPRDEITHIAIGHGDWDDPANWYNGEVPGDDARVLIPEGIHMTYDHVNEARLFTLRVDGKLEFSTETSSQMIVDTIVISPSGFLEIGTAENPVNPNVNVDIIFANNGPIDTDWDPMLLSRGMIAHGNVEIHGAEKDSHAKVVDDPMKGDTSVDMGTTPTGWAVGDTIVIAGTSYEGYHQVDLANGFIPPEDEIRVITHIEDGLIFFDDPLLFDHDTPRDDLKTSVANYTRNVSFETENAETAEVFERGHVMFMHNNDVDVRYAEFHELGRTDKSIPSQDADDFASIAFDSNVKGRYSFHFHRAGLEDQDDPGIAMGNAVFGSPGWGFVHHDSNAILENNATYDTYGAGYVAESGNETGAWVDNIAIFAQGIWWREPKLGADLENFDLGRTGDGFWFQGRMVESVDNIAASVNHGFVYFHRGPTEDDAMLRFSSEVSEVSEIFYNDYYVTPDHHPILSFSGNESFASRSGLHVVKANPKQFHDVHSVLEDFTAWNVQFGAELQYTAHYTLENFDLIGTDTGIKFGNNVFDIAIVDPTIEGFHRGINLHKEFVDTNLSADLHDYTIVNPTFVGDTGLVNYDPNLDTLLETEDLPNLTPDIELAGRLTMYDNYVGIAGTKSDGLGETEFPSGPDVYGIDYYAVRSLLNTEGYYSTSAGEDYFLVDIFFSDRLTGDIYSEKHPVFVDESVGLGEKWPYADVVHHGILDLDGSESDPTNDVAELWATLTDGQVILADDMPTTNSGENEEALADVF